MWDVLKIHGVGDHLFKRIRSFYEDLSVSEDLKVELCENFGVCVGVSNGCMCLCVCPQESSIQLVLSLHDRMSLFVNANILQGKQHFSLREVK